jgi:hypothetical protein
VQCAVASSRELESDTGFDGRLPALLLAFQLSASTGFLRRYFHGIFGTVDQLTYFAHEPDRNLWIVDVLPTISMPLLLPLLKVRLQVLRRQLFTIKSTGAIRSIFAPRWSRRGSPSKFLEWLHDLQTPTKEKRLDWLAKNETSKILGTSSAARRV